MASTTLAWRDLVDHARSSVDKILANLASGQPVRAFSDRSVSPSYVEDVVVATTSLFERASPPGLYHCVNAGWTTWVGIARELARLAGREDAVIEEVLMARRAHRTACRTHTAERALPRRVAS